MLLIHVLLSNRKWQIAPHLLNFIKGTASQLIFCATVYTHCSTLTVLTLQLRTKHIKFVHYEVLTTTHTKYSQYKYFITESFLCRAVPTIVPRIALSGNPALV